jgi:glycosyltransferase involved in cell wall biosynthesis
MSAETQLPEFSVVVPCYNELAGLRQTLAQLTATLRAAGPHEVLVVNDGSTDNSGALLAELQPAMPGLRVVTHPHNRGYGAALKTGLRHARAELIVITDADGTYPNERIPELVTLCREADMVVGARTVAGTAYPLMRRIPKAVLRVWVCWLVRAPVPDINSGLRVFRKSVAERFLHILPDTFSFTTTITMALLQGRYDVRFVPIQYAPRLGRSKIKPVQDTLRFVQLILRTGTYFAPLRVFLPVACLLGAGAAASFLYDALVLRNLTDKTVLLFLFTLNAGMFAVLADLIVRRTSR